jgi:hypothetical protein
LDRLVFPGDFQLFAFTGPVGKPVVLRAGVENLFDRAY